MLLRQTHWLRAVILPAAFGVVLFLVLVGSAWLDAVDKDTRLFMLTSISQTVGAVFGVSVTLIFVVTQMTAQHQTIRAVHLILEDPALRLFTWVNIAALGVSMLLVPNENYFTVTSPFLARMDEALALSLACASFVSIPQFIRRAMLLLNPTTMVEQLLNEVTAEGILQNTTESSLEDSARRIMDTRPTQEDPLSSLADIAAMAVQSGHFDTAGQTMKMMVSRVCELTDHLVSTLETNVQEVSPLDRDSRPELMMERLFLHLERIVGDATTAQAHALYVPLDYMALRIRKMHPSVHALLLTFVSDLPETFNDHVVQFLTQYGPWQLEYGGDAGQPMAQMAASILQTKKLEKQAIARLSIVSGVRRTPEHLREHYEQFLKLLG